MIQQPPLKAECVGVSEPFHQRFIHVIIYIVLRVKITEQD